MCSLPKTYREYVRAPRTAAKSLAFEMQVIKLSLVQRYASVSQPSVLGFSYILLKYLLITLKRKKKYVGAFVYK